MGHYARAERINRLGRERHPEEDRLQTLEQRYANRVQLREFLLSQGIEWKEQAFYESACENQARYVVLDGPPPSANQNRYPQALVLLRFGRMSNFLIQLSNAMGFALRVGVKEIHAPADSVTTFLFSGRQSVAIPDCGLLLHLGMHRKDILGLASTFFHMRRDLPGVFDGIPPRNILLRSLGKSIDLETNGNSQQRLSSNHGRILTIHLRSGDVFSEASPYDKLGQPPLSYYIMAIEHYAPEAVLMVHEDNLNPVIQLLQDYLNDRGLPNSSASSGDLRSDVLAIAHASALVMSRGTFAKGIVALRDTLKTCYLFCEQYCSEIDQVSGFVDASVDLYNIYDANGDYARDVLFSWAGSDHQKQMMREYPREHLLMEQLP